MSKINLPQLPGWPRLGEQERYHAGYLARKIGDNYDVKEWRPGCVHQVHYNYQEETSAEQITRFAYDSLLCALTHEEPQYTLRAYVQAAEYVARLRQMASDRVISHAPADLFDSLHCARVRVEKMVL